MTRTGWLLLFAGSAALYAAYGRGWMVSVPSWVSTFGPHAPTIYRALRLEGLSDVWASAAVVNALAESGTRDLDGDGRRDIVPDAVGDGGASVGPFQLHERGAGKGFSFAERSDPVSASRIIAAEARRRLGARLDEPVSLAEAIRLWCSEVERPASREEPDRRVALALSRGVPGV